MVLHNQQGRKRKTEGVVTIEFDWKAADDLPDVHDQDYPQFAALTGENEAGFPTEGAVNTAWLGEISTVREDKRKVTIITPYRAYEKLQAADAIDAGSLGKFVFQDQQVLPFDPATMNDSDVAGLVLTTAAAQGDDVWVLRK